MESYNNFYREKKMIKHIVFFKLKASTTREKAKGLVRDLSRLKEKIPQVCFLEVAFDIGKKHNSHDIVLYSHFESLEDLEIYSVHPEHIKVVQDVKNICESSCKVDYEA